LQRVSAGLEDGRAITRFSTQVAAAFAGLALLLSMIGVYALVASDVARRGREVAVRLALGASSREVLWTVMRPCALMMAAGAALGVVGAWSVGPALRALLRGIDPADPGTLAATPAALGLFGLLVAAAAARRVLVADFAATLRDE
jgi:ABC-type antimicrobial peptide transport system permease subunit